MELDYIIHFTLLTNTNGMVLVLLLQLCNLNVLHFVVY